MEKNLELKVSDKIKIPGTHPIVIIGPNGAGKTRLGAKLAQSNNAYWIGALRNLEMQTDIPMAAPEQAGNQVKSLSNTLKSSPWTLSNELTWLMAKLLAEDSKSAMEYRNKSLRTPGQTPVETNLIKLTEFWHHNFPHRKIDLFSYRPTAVSDLGTSTNPYPIAQMGDGERVALYLAAKVFDAPPGLIIIDEPEVHFHSLLAKQYWNGLEKIRSDCRFVYITHDLHFALSRKSAQFMIIYKNESPQLVETEIPGDIIEQILGAASFSVSARRIVFCEGTRGSDKEEIPYDEILYEAWFNDIDTAVIPVGSCDEVIKCVEVFNSNKAIVGANAIGIIDRDYWPDDYFSNLSPNIHVLKVHEVESLLCLPEVFYAVAKYLQIPNDQMLKKYNDFIAKAKNHFKNAIYNKQILERAKRQFELNALALVNNVSTNDDLTKVETDFAMALDPNKWNFKPNELLYDEEAKFKAAIGGKEIDFLRLFPGKSYISHAMQELGIQASRFIEIVTAALSLPDDAKPDANLNQLKIELVQALRNYLPDRKIPN